MKEDVAERLIESAAKLIAENVELNVLIRNALAVNETIHAINARIDGILGASRQLEKGVQLDESRLRQLEEQSAIIKEGLSAFNATTEGLNTTMQRWEGKVDVLDESVKALGKKGDLCLDRQYDNRLEEGTRWAQTSTFIERLRWRVSIMWIIHVITVAVLVGIFIALKFH
jgi:septal ring factor EnvC (AmiA/AmiB activator)